MSTTVENSRMPKPFLQGVISKYTQLVNNIDGIIRETGYKQAFIAKKLSMPIATFYLKKRTCSFTPVEISQIVDMLDDNTNTENKYLLDLAESRWNEETVSYDDMMQLLGE